MESESKFTYTIHFSYTIWLPNVYEKYMTAHYIQKGLRRPYFSGHVADLPQFMKNLHGNRETHKCRLMKANKKSTAGVRYTKNKIPSANLLTC